MLVSLDVETTGFDPQKNHIIEIAAIKFDNKKIVDQFQTLVNIQIPLPKIITTITGITEKDLKNAPRLEDIKLTLQEFISDLPILGHNIQFDINFLKAKNIELKNKLLDTCQLASALLINEPSYSLEILCKKYNITHLNTHRAFDDALAALSLYLLLRKKIEGIPKETLEKICKYLRKSDFAFKETFLRAKNKKIKQESEKQPALFKEKSTKLIKATPKNLDLQNLISNSIKNNKNLICECEDYNTEDLIAAALSLPASCLPTRHAKKTTNKTLICTENLTQIKQTPEIKSLLSPSNYLCQNRLKTFLEKPHLQDEEAAFLIKILTWLPTTKKGQKQEISLHMNEYKHWNSTASHDLYCQNCGEECFFKKAKIESKKTNIIITDPWFLIKNIHEKHLESTDHLIIDQAEKLGEFTQKSFSKTFTLDFLIFKIDNLILKYPNKKAKLEGLKQRIELLFGLLGIFLEKYKEEGQFKKQVILDQYTKNTLEWKRIKESTKNLEQILKEVIPEKKKITYPHEYYEIKESLKKITETVEQKEDEITQITQTKDGQPFIKTIPLNVEKILKKNLWQNKKTTALISKSLQTSRKDSFQYIKKELYFDLETEEKHLPRKTDKKMPFFIIKNLPPPKNTNNFKETGNLIAKIINKLKGKIFVLVSSLRTVEQMHLKLAPYFKERGINVLSQNSTGGRGKIETLYLENPENSVIMGNFSFFQGLEPESIENISRLIVHRLPFEPPSDFKNTKYQNEFEARTIPQAIIKLKQIIYKLETLNKTVILLDNRAVDKDFGQTIIKNLPSFVETMPVEDETLLKYFD